MKDQKPQLTDEGKESNVGVGRGAKGYGKVIINNVNMKKFRFVNNHYDACWIVEGDAILNRSPNWMVVNEADEIRAEMSMEHWSFLGVEGGSEKW